jgi:hypothetical protein
MIATTIRTTAGVWSSPTRTPSPSWSAWPAPGTATAAAVTRWAGPKGLDGIGLGQSFHFPHLRKQYHHPPTATRTKALRFVKEYRFADREDEERMAAFVKDQQQGGGVRPAAMGGSAGKGGGIGWWARPST